MIFVTVGSQKFQFNRLLKEIDKLIEEKKINEEVFAQSGCSDYKPKNYNYKKFLDRDEFVKVMKKCDKVITHGGTGAIINGIKQKKKVIAVPRLEKFGEHVDNHQLQILNEFEKLNLIIANKNIDELSNSLILSENFKFVEYKSNTKKIISSIEEIIKLV